MATAACPKWKPEDYCLNGLSETTASLAELIFRRVCRSDFDAPGFCLVNFGSVLSSPEFRLHMVRVYGELRNIHQKHTGDDLLFESATRFDQQVSTKLHLDGGPEESLLMLGYEPSSVQSSFTIADYSRFAFDRAIEPIEALEQYNPMFKAGQTALQPYTTHISCFMSQDYQIVFVNNSFAPYSSETPRWQGVMHGASVLNPDDDQRRVINSTQLASHPLGAEPRLGWEELNSYTRTDHVNRRGYDKQHLEDD